MIKYFPRYLIITAKHAAKIEPIKYLGKYMPCSSNSSMCRKKQSICDKIAFLYFTLILFRENNSLNTRECLHF